MSSHDLDIEEKIASLIGAFSHKREVILQVLKKNNYGIDASALELSEMPLVSEQPPTYIERQPIRLQPIGQQQQAPVQQAPVQQAPVQQSAQQQLKERNELIKDIENLIGNNSLDQSTIYAVYQQSNKSIDQTIKTIKELTFDPNEEMKKIEAEIEARKAEEEAMMNEARISRERQQLLIEQQTFEREQQKRLREEYERRLMIENQKKLELERADAELIRRKQLEQKQMQLLREQEENGLAILREQKQHQEKLRIAQLKEEELKKKAIAEETKRLEEISRMNKQQQADQEKKRLEQQQKQEKEILLALEVKSMEAQSMQQQTLSLKQKEQENLLLIEKQKKEIHENQIQIDILKQKELESQQNQQLLEKAKLEIHDLKKKLVEGEIKFNQENDKKSSEERQKRDNEDELKKQIQSLEHQKEQLRLQILDLEGIQRPRMLELEHELKLKQMELENTIISNQVSLSANIEGDASTAADTIVVHWNLESKFEETATYWIGIFPTHQPKNDRYFSFKHIEGKEGLVSFQSIIPGHYEARLFKDKYTLVQKSSSVQVGPTIVLTAHVIGDEISVTYRSNDSAHLINNKDWLGIYSLDARNKRYTESLYANPITGESTFKSPRVPGIYEIRYFLYPTKYNEQAKISFEIKDNDRVQILAIIEGQCQPFGEIKLLPEQEFKVDYIVNTCPPCSSDWVGIFPVDELNNKSYIYSKYTSATGTGELTFRAPLKSGQYEARFFSYAKGKYQIHKVSNQFSVSSNQ